MLRYDMSNEKEIIVRELIPEGDRVLEVINVELKTSKRGSEMLEWSIRDIETGKTDILYTITAQGKRWALKVLLAACKVIVDDGEIYTFEIKDLIGKIIVGTNKHIIEDWVNREGVTVPQAKNKFTRFMPYVKKEDDEGIPF